MKDVYKRAVGELVTDIAVAGMDSFRKGYSVRDAMAEKVVGYIPNNIDMIQMKNYILSKIKHSGRRKVNTVFCRCGEEWRNLEQEDLVMFMDIKGVDRHCIL